MDYQITTKKTWVQTLDALADTMRLWGIGTWKVENPLPPRARTNRHQTPEQRMVTLTYTKDGVEIVLHMNRQERAVDNLRALYLAVEDMRMIERRGVDDLVRQAYAQLPPPVDAITPTGAYAALGIMPNATTDEINAAYRARAMKSHPDHGGSDAAMRELNAARATIYRERGIV